MANKAAKQLARANAATLNRTHAISLALHALFIFYRLLFRRGSWPKYLVLSFPSVVIELYLERLGRPTYASAAAGGGDGLRSAGEDLEAKGVTEYMWDIVYVTWGVLGMVGVAGDWAWWLWAIVPMYAIYLVAGTYQSMKNGMMPGMPPLSSSSSSSSSTTPGGSSSQQSNAGQSNRQKKAEKRGGQKVRYT